MNDQRTLFYKNVSAFRRRRRRTISVYLPEEQGGLDQNRIQINNTKSLEEMYMQYNNIETPDPTRANISKNMRMAGEAVTRNVYQQYDDSLSNGKINPTNNGMMPNNKNNKRRVEYNDANGKYYKIGGSPAWRHNNPGNLSFGSFESAREAGAIGVVIDRHPITGKIRHIWGIFDSPEAGEKAMRDKLKSRRFSYDSKTGAKRSIADMIENIYAPNNENDSKAYVRFVKNMSGLDVHNRSVSDLTPAECDKLVESIKAREGWGVGNIIRE